MALALETSMMKIQNFLDFIFSSTLTSALPARRRLNAAEKHVIISNQLPQTGLTRTPHMSYTKSSTLTYLL